MLSVLYIPVQLCGIVMDACIWTVIPATIARLYATSIGIVASRLDGCGNYIRDEGDAWQCRLEFARVFACICGVLLSSVYAAQFFVTGAWRDRGPRRMWRLSVDGLPGLELLLLVLNSLLWTALPVFAACVLQDCRTLVQEGRLTLCEHCNMEAAGLAVATAAIVLSLHVGWRLLCHLLTRHPRSTIGLVTLLSVLDEAVVKLQLGRAARELRYARRAVFAPEHLLVALDSRADGTALGFIDRANDELNDIRQRAFSCLLSLTMAMPPWLEARCHGAGLRDELGRLEQHVNLHRELDEDLCAEVLGMTSRLLYPTSPRSLLESAPFERCTSLWSYEKCAAMQAEQLRNASSLEALYLLTIRADAYDLCGHYSRSGLFSSGGVQSRELLLAVAELPQTPVEIAPRLRALADFAARRFALVTATHARITNGVRMVCDAAAIATHAPAAEAALELRKVGRVTLVVQGVLLWRTRCSGDNTALVSQLQALIAIKAADFEMHELLGDAQEALATSKGGRVSLLMAALRAYKDAYRMAPMTSMLSIWRLKGKVEALEALIGAKRGGRKDGGAPPPPEGRFRMPWSPPPPQAGAGDGGGACTERPRQGDALTLLGLDKSTCTKLDVKKSFRRKALDFHPDKYDGDKECAEMHFNQLKSAHDSALSMCKA